jgi:hypothetical protein
VCYTFNANLIGIRQGKGWRVVCNKMIGQPPKDLQYIQYKNMHTKLYLLYQNNKVQNVLIGSQNFNSPTYYEAMYYMRKRDFVGAKEYFSTLWNSSSKIVL